jgi:hypothetical protein
MSTNVVVFGWDRSTPGREKLSGQHFQEFVQYLQGQQAQRNIESFDPIFLEPHGGALNGFIVIRGEPAKLATLIASPEWVQHQTRAMLHLEGSAVWRGVAGATVSERMDLWMRQVAAQS